MTSRCPDCKGEGVIECSGVHPRRYPGGVSAMEAPDTWTERCETCDGTGDRRERERTALDRVWDDDERVANLAMNRGQTIRRMQAEIDRLVKENRALRTMVQHQARILDSSEPARVSYAQAEGEMAS